MMRLLYALAWWIAAPFVVARLAWRARRQPRYLERVGERFGRYARAEPARRIWIHAVSVGETRAALPLVEELRKRHPERRILMTHMTPTGRATGEDLFGDRVERVWLPYDLGFATRRFFERFRPELGIVMETELWPRLLEEARRAGVPVMLANARLSERSAQGYARAPSVTRWALSNLAGIAAQTADDARRFASLGAREPAILGNVKFDLDIPPAMVREGRRLRERLGDARRVWVAGSTREGEEKLLLEAFAAHRDSREALLVIVPRHPQRFDEVAAMSASMGFVTARRSEGRAIAPEARVVIGDSMGEMLAYYAAADVVIVGGSLLEYGAQNLIEACALGRPVIVGPSTFNFAQAAAEAVERGAAVAVRDAREALAEAEAIGADPARRDAMGRKALDFVAAHRGAVRRLADWIDATAAAARA
jgi:3-deoxy-D-manno-octulosonic-acid transferase